MKMQIKKSPNTETLPILQFCEEIKELLKPFLRLKTIKKNKILLRENETCKNIYFIQEGVIKEYSLDKEGKEFIVHFYLKGSMACQFDSFLSQRASLTYLEVLEGSKIWKLRYQDFESAVKNIPVFSEKIAVAIAKATANRLNLLLTCDATIRYQKFMAQEFQGLLQIPHNMIALYLGVSPDALHQIKKNVYENNLLNSK